VNSARWLEAQLRSGIEAWIPLAGWSMAPSLRPGDRLRVAPLDGKPARGDIVVARRGPRLVTHRLVTLDGRGAVTRGDACTADDPPIDVAALVGRVVEVRRASWLSRVVRGLRRRVR
jgi:signal peptidase I